MEIKAKLATLSSPGLTGGSMRIFLDSPVKPGNDRSCLARSIIFILSILFCANIYAAGNDARVGISVGGVTWGDGLLGVSYDQKGVLQLQNWTAGGEIDLLDGGFVVLPRAFYWQKANLSGLYGGPVAAVGVLQHGHYNSSYAGNFENILVGAGGGGGWLYRFPTNRIDVGGAVDVLATNYGVWVGLKATVGYLIH